VCTESWPTTIPSLIRATCTARLPFTSGLHGSAGTMETAEVYQSIPVAVTSDSSVKLRWKNENPTLMLLVLGGQQSVRARQALHVLM